MFVRELVQNARDAGARAVHFRVDVVPEGMRVACRDDGDGMTLEHARRFLFTLYASSKGGGADAGRFGVGFWSVLRFEPARVLVRSWPRRGEAWQVALAGDLSGAVQAEPPVCPLASGHGTEVVLERPGLDRELLRRVGDAARQSARFATQRGSAGRALDLRVNGVRQSETFTLPAPSASFRRGRSRGVVGLGQAARVELFARGLRVRSAAALADLAAGHPGSRVRFPESDGLVPQALLDSEEVEPLLARSDVKDDAALRRLLDLAERELARLVDRHLARARPVSRVRRAARALGAVAALVVLAAAGHAGWRVFAARPAAQEGVVSATPAPVIEPPAASAAPIAVEAGVRPPRLVLEPFRDLGGAYEGPRASRWSDTLRAPILRYKPESMRPLLAVLHLEDVGAPPPAAVESGPYAGAACEDDCLDVELVLHADASGLVRLPRPTGYVLDPRRVEVDGRAAPLVATALGEPALRMETAGSHVVRYRSGPGVEAHGVLPAASAPLPGMLRLAAATLPAQDPDERVDAALRYVRESVRYSTAEDVVERHRAAAASGLGVLERALAVGAGDCDVQNAVLTALLQASGQPARLTIGYVGVAGTVVPALHAWVEWRGPAGRWRAADASAEAPTPPLSPALPLNAAAEPPAGIPAPPRRWAGVAALLALAGVAALGLVFARRGSRSERLEAQPDVMPLLKGALARPEAFRHVPAVFERPLLPALGGAPAPLGRAWDLATRRRLFASRAGTDLARRAARRGAVVLDASRPESALAADALGAIDLDAWDALLRRSRPGPIEARIERAFRSGGEPLRLLAAEGLEAPLVLDLPRGAGRRGSERTLVVGRAAGAGGAEDAFRLAHALSARLGLPPLRAARVLGPLAEAALEEAAR